jgi:hypothetical protein
MPCPVKLSNVEQIKKRRKRVKSQGAPKPMWQFAFSKLIADTNMFYSCLFLSKLEVEGQMRRDEICFIVYCLTLDCNRTKGLIEWFVHLPLLHYA